MEKLNVGMIAQCTSFPQLAMWEDELRKQEETICNPYERIGIHGLLLAVRGRMAEVRTMMEADDARR